MISISNTISNIIRKDTISNINRDMGILIGKLMGIQLAI